jgi:hypothetical protein
VSSETIKTVRRPTQDSLTADTRKSGAIAGAARQSSTGIARQSVCYLARLPRQSGVTAATRSGGLFGRAGRSAHAAANLASTNLRGTVEAVSVAGQHHLPSFPLTGHREEESLSITYVHARIRMYATYIYNLVGLYGYLQAWVYPFSINNKGVSSDLSRPYV